MPRLSRSTAGLYLLRSRIPPTPPAPHFLRPTLATMASEAARKLRPIVICGPSGSGKSTILGRLFKEYPDTFSFSISHTTRAPRGAEKNGVEYHFTTPDAFAALVKENGFIEHATFGSNSYGTSVAALNTIAETGRIAVLDIEMEGVKQIKKHPDFASTARFLFLAPPSEEILEQRLRGRGTDSEEAIGKRLAKAKVELEFGRSSGAFEKIVVNDDLERAYKEVREWVFQGNVPEPKA